MLTNPEILIVAGEASGDHYGAALVHRIHEQNPCVRFFGMGGDRMAATGVDLVHHIKEVSVMGFVEVLARLGPLYRSFHRLVDEARARQPLAAVFIDFPDYNLRLAPRIKEVSGAKTVYYIGPTVWAWRPGRIDTVKRAIDKMLVIFPFEEPLYRERGVDVEFVGHPLVGEVKVKSTADEFKRAHNLRPDRRLVGLLPGSRAREVELILPLLGEAARALRGRGHDVEVALGLADSIERKQVERVLGPDSGIAVLERSTHELMKHAEVLLVACGTAPLEAAILGTPQVVVYRTSPLTFGIASRLVDVPHICIVNLILGKRAVPELVQDELTPEAAALAVERLLRDPAARAAQQADFHDLRTRLGSAGAARRAAAAVVAGAGLANFRPPCEIV